MNKTQARDLVRETLKPCIGVDMDDRVNKVMFEGLFNRCLRDLNRAGFRIHPDTVPNWTLVGCQLEVDNSLSFSYVN